MPIGHGAFRPVGQAGIGKSVPALRAEGEENSRDSPGGIPLILCRQEKPRCKKHRRPYCKPTQVGWGKCPKVNERTLVKELDNLAL